MHELKHVKYHGKFGNAEVEEFKIRLKDLKSCLKTHNNEALAATFQFRLVEAFLAIFVAKSMGSGAVDPEDKGWAQSVWDVLVKDCNEFEALKAGTSIWNAQPDDFKKSVSEGTQNTVKQILGWLVLKKEYDASKLSALLNKWREYFQKEKPLNELEKK